MTQISQLARLGLFDAKVPRYTSYPTAPHFSAGVGADTFMDWVGAIAPGAKISLYLHVPFCRKLCWFCACRTQGTQSNAPVEAYVQTLKAEIALLAQHLPAGVELSRLHWGGGTPTLLPPVLMQELLDAIFDCAPMAKGGEFSVEIDPNEIDSARLDVLAATGMSRASIGVQDFDPEIQKTIGRIQPFKVTRAAVDMIRERGIRSLNADILFGLPGQSHSRMADSVQKLLSLAPDRVALYGYAHVPWMARRQTMIPSESLPTPETRLQLFETARRLFVWDGYADVGIDHFAAPHDGLAEAARAGRLHRNFQGYTEDGAPVLIGLGASSISRFPQGYAQNAPSTSAYTKFIRAGQFATTRGHAFSGDDRLRARLIEALMCNFAISSSEILQAFEVSNAKLNALFGTAQAAFPGVVQVTGEGLSITADGRPLTRMIARHFDAYDLNKAGHSYAI